MPRAADQPYGRVRTGRTLRVVHDDVGIVTITGRDSHWRNWPATSAPHQLAGMTVETAPVVVAEVLEVALPLMRPFVTGFGVTDTRRTVLVHLIDEAGYEGWGEAPALDHPYYLPDTTASTY